MKVNQVNQLAGNMKHSHAILRLAHMYVVVMSENTCYYVLTNKSRFSNSANVHTTNSSNVHYIGDTISEIYLRGRMVKNLEKYVIDNNIEIVKGAKNACLVNLNTGKLYSIDRRFLNLFELVRERQFSLVSNDFCDALVSESILVKYSTKSPLSNRPTPDPKLRFAWIEVTQRCNLRCVHCYENATDGFEQKDMTLHNFIDVIDKLKLLGINKIQLIGGEPLLNSNIYEMLNYCSGKFEYVELFTNGTLLTEKLLYLIKETSINVAISLFAVSCNLHDSVTQVQGSYNMTKQNIDKIVGLGIPLRIASIEMKNIPVFSFSDNALPHRSDLPRLTGRATLSLYSREMLKKKVVTQNSFNRFIDPMQFYKNAMRHNCFSEKIYIDIRGNTYPCVMERRTQHNSLLNNSVSGILKQEICSFTKDMIHECCDCEFRYVCFDCRPDANGCAFNAKPWFCTYDPYQGKWIDVDDFINEISRKEV